MRLIGTYWRSARPFPAGQPALRWPTTQAAAEKAVEDSRQARREGGEAIEDGAAWIPAEFVVATAARMPLVKGAICTFKIGIVKLNKLIWPAAEQPGAPDTTANVVDML